MAEPSRDDVMAALAKIDDPAFGKPMAELGLVSEVKVEGARVSLHYRASAPSRELDRAIREALVRGLAPLGVTDVHVDFQLLVPMRQLTGDDPVPNVRNVLLVMSGKGGVGKSTCAANIAVALRRAGARVGLLDADIYGPSIPTMFAVNEHPRATEEKRIEPITRHGLSLMSIGFLLEDPKAAIVWRGPMLHSALQQFLKDVDWGTLDYLVLDLPPGTGDVALTLAQRVRVTGAVIVTTPQEVALQDVYKSVSMCGKLNIPILGVIENMSYFVDPAGVRHELFGKGGGAKIAEFAKAPLLGQIPIDPVVRQDGDGGTPVVEEHPDAPVAQSFQRLAEDLAVRIAVHHFERTGATKAPPTESPTRLRIVR